MEDEELNKTILYAIELTVISLSDSTLSYPGGPPFLHKYVFISLLKAFIFIFVIAAASSNSVF